MASNQLNDITIQSGFTSEAMVRDIVLQFPKSADYFKAKRIDFCCGGAKPLAEAAAEKGLDPEAMIQDLNKLQEEHPVLEEDTAWNEASSEELVNYIVNKHHRYLREELPLISQNVTKVFRVHGEDSPHLGEMHRLFNLCAKICFSIRRRKKRANSLKCWPTHRTRLKKAYRSCAACCIILKLSMTVPVRSSASSAG